MFSLKYAKDSVKTKRSAVAGALLKDSANIESGKITKISEYDLAILFQFYDQIFFDNWFRDNFKGRFKFSLSRRMSKSAGITKCPKSIGRVKPEEITIEISIGVNLFFQYDQLDGVKTVCGIETCNSLEALLIVFEHELCHALEFIIFNSSNCRASRFREISADLFGHSESHHKIPTNRQIISRKLGIDVGDSVGFLYGGRRMSGVISGINKRATVMVRNMDGKFIDRAGNRYMKYYVPVGCVEKIS